jgi:capsule biosynthesis phosphatase
MLFHLIDNLKFKKCDTLFIALRDGIDEEFQLTSQVRDEYPNLDLKVVHLKYDTRGAAETLYIVTQSMEDEELTRRTISLDCDTIYFKDILSAVRQLPPSTSACVHFYDTGDKPVFSYIELDSDNNIINIKEKKAITRNANTGAYIFESAKVLKDNATMLLDKPNALGDVGEYYTSSIISSMVTAGSVFKGIAVDECEFYCVGTPDQLESFLDYIKDNPHLVKKRRFCFDLDSTLVSRPRIRGDYSTVEPIWKNIELVRDLKAAGHYIIIQTARRMRTHGGNVGAVIRDIAKVTFASLEKFSIPYDEIHFGKPWAHVYVDDLAVNAMLDTRKELGWKFGDQSWKQGQSPECNGMIAARSFNLVQIFEQNVMKSSRNPALLGEMFYYANMPDDLINVFPTALGFNFLSDMYSMTMTKISGISFSHLLVNRSMTIGRLVLFLETLAKIHRSHGVCSKPFDLVSIIPDLPLKPSTLMLSEMYDNYVPKVSSRFNLYQSAYLALDPDVESLYGKILAALRLYEELGAGIYANVIHGDPVFSNVILSLDGGVRMLDMRGCIGTRYTIAGDLTYDLAKCYQSLRGYDIILLKGNSSDQNRHKPLSTVLNHLDRRMLREFEAVFWDHIATTYPTVRKKHVQWITASLLFSLIPLHEEPNRPLFYELIKELVEEIEL